MLRSSFLGLAMVISTLGCSTTDFVLTDSGTPKDRGTTDSPVVLDAPFGLDGPVGPEVSTQDSPGSETLGEVSGCATGQTICASTCVDTRTDSAHCGACGRACAMGENCAAGSCRSTVVCEEPQTNCAGECVNLQSETRHCGMCGRSCLAGETCAMGVCRTAVVCPTGQTDCGGTCVDTQTNAMNCGGCGMPCTDTEVCEAGACNPRMCPAGQERCGAVCVSTQSDAANCGMCGQACSATEICTAGACQPLCPAPRLSCTTPSGAMVCVDPMTDGAHCGGCGMPCAAGLACVAGVCGCPMGQTLCGALCVDSRSDPAHCGGCAMRCAASQSCTSGACRCPEGRTLCAGECVNTMTDLAHCGACARACSAPSSCSAGVCNSLCAIGTTSCAGRCVNPTIDMNNCGACGVVCGRGTTCLAGGVPPTMGACRPANNDRLNATPVALGASETTVTGSTSNATQDGPSPCGCTSGANVWYRFSLARAEVLYLDTAGSAYDTSLFVTDTGGTPVAAQATTGVNNPGLCNDDAGCQADTTTGFTSGFQSVSYGILNAGTYYVSVGGCSAGAFNLHIQHIPTNVGTNFVQARIQGAGNTTGTLPLASTTSGTCGGSGSGEDVRWFVTCGGPTRQAFFSLCASDGGSFVRRIGASYLDPSVYIRSGISNAETVCNDDGGSMGGTNCVGTALPAFPAMSSDSSPYGSRINNVTLPRGIHALFVDERIRAPTVSAQMGYNLRYTVR